MTRAARQQGFTLVEMLVVLGLIGLIAGLGAPALDRVLRGTDFRAATVRVELALRQRQAEAVRTGQPRGLTAEELRSIAGGPDERRRSATLRVEGPQRGYVFLPDGTSKGGYAVLSDGPRSARFVVDGDLPLLRSE